MHRSKRISLLMSTMAFLSSVMTVYGEDKSDSPSAKQIEWGKVADGLQLGIFPDTVADGLPKVLFDGRTLNVNVQVRNTGKSPVHFLPSTFGCAALGPNGAIPVTKLILTPSQGEEPFSITYQGPNHLSSEVKLDAEDLEYYTTVLAPGQCLDYPYLVKFTPGEERATSWQRVGESNLFPEGKYRLKAVFVIDRNNSPWKGELTSGSLDVELHQRDKR